MPALVPLLVLILSFFLTAIPLGLPGDATFAPPMMMLAVVFVCSAAPGAQLPAWMAMAFGLAADIVTASPLGYWGLLALLAHGAGSSVAAEKWAGRFVFLWPLWIVTAASIALAAWCLASLYFLRWIGWEPLANGAVIAMIGFPLAYGAVGMLRRLLPQSSAGAQSS